MLLLELLHGLASSWAEEPPFHLAFGDIVAGACKRGMELRDLASHSSDRQIWSNHYGGLHVGYDMKSSPKRAFGSRTAYCMRSKTRKCSIPAVSTCKNSTVGSEPI